MNTMHEIIIESCINKQAQAQAQALIQKVKKKTTEFGVRRQHYWILLFNCFSLASDEYLEKNNYALIEHQLYD